MREPTGIWMMEIVSRGQGILAEINQVQNDAWKFARNDENRGELERALKAHNEELTAFDKSFLALEPKQLIDVNVEESLIGLLSAFAGRTKYLDVHKVSQTLLRRGDA